MQKIQTVQQFKSAIMRLIVLALSTSGIVFSYTGSRHNLPVLFVTGFICFIVDFFIVFLSVSFWAVRNNIDHGIIYAWKHYILLRSLEEHLLNADIYIIKRFGQCKLAKPPWIRIAFDKESNYKCGRVFIANNVKFHERLSKLDISSALHQYVVEQAYLEPDGNHYCYEFYDASIVRRLTFESFDAFKTYSDSYDDYELFVDKYTNVVLTHQLLVGQTGSGKSYALFSYLLQMLLKRTKYNLYFADPKSSSTALLGEKLSPNTTADNFDDIVKLLEAFVLAMHERQLEIKEHLETKLDGDYRDFGLSPSILIFDEYADFSQLLQTKDKKLRDTVNSLIAEVVLKGRQSGFFLWVVMQQAGSNNIPTYVRDNLPWKTVLGNAEDQTYITAFGTGVDIPKRDMEIGEGVFTYPSIANKPKLCSFSTLGFDILKAIGKAGVL